MSVDFEESLCCPQTKLLLRSCSLAEAERLISNGQPLCARSEGLPPAIGRTANVMLREDLLCAYPIVDEIPVLLVPEMLVGNENRGSVDLKDPRWAEAYEEMDHYNAACVAEALELDAGARSPIPREAEKFAYSFPEPARVWIDAPYDASAQIEAYRNLGNIQGKRIAQLGGKGKHAVEFLLAGASEAWLITPMVGECIYSNALARSFGVENRLKCVAAVGEQMPLRADSLDVIYSGGCIHHMVAESVASEVYRVLAPGGHFSAVDPWKTFLHTMGTRMLGKREDNVHCKPMTPQRLAPFHLVFSELKVTHHGPILRYFLLGVCKLLRIELGVPLGYRLGRFEDQTLSRIPFLRDHGGSIAMMCAKAYRRPFPQGDVEPVTHFEEPTGVQI
jgi:SAM-dependent methyltransferase